MNRLGQFPGSYDPDPEDPPWWGKVIGIMLAVLVAVPVFAIVVGSLVLLAVTIWEGIL